MRPDSPGQRDVGRVPVYSVKYGKSWDAEPGRVRLGQIRLRGWRLDRLSPVPPGLDGRVPYLVRVHYEFEVEPGAAPLPWAEVQFAFDEDIIVGDARPIRVTEPQGDVSYQLTSRLEFVPWCDGASDWPTGSPAAEIPLPAMPAGIVGSGVGGPAVAWRHSGGVAPGGYVGLLVVLVPGSRDVLKVIATGNYGVDLGPDRRTVAREDAFSVRLPPAAAPAGPAAAAGPAAGPVTSANHGEPGGPRVFVSYAQESGSHKAAVGAFCDFLNAQGLDVQYDQQNLHERRNWARWTNAQFRLADKVIVIASPGYLAAAEGSVAPGERLGVRSEYDRLVDLHHSNPDEWTKKILPVVLPGRSPKEIPLAFGPATCDYYEVEDFSSQGAADLLRVLRGPGDAGRP